MENTIIREFEGNPNVTAVIFCQGGQNGETRAWLETFWSSYYLRGGVIWDETGAVGALYGQPSTGLPFGRGFIIDPEGRVSLPYFGHQPQMAIAAIHEMLAASGLADPGWVDGSGRVDGVARLAPIAGLRVVPNPAADRVSLELEMRRPSTVHLRVFDAAGRAVMAGRTERVSSGRQTILLDGSILGAAAVPSGIYFLRVQADGQAATRRIVRVR